MVMHLVPLWAMHLVMQLVQQWVTLRVPPKELRLATLWATR